MEIGALNLFLKMVKEDYKLDIGQMQVLNNRLLADEKEFEIVWKQFKSRSLSSKNGNDSFRPVLFDLLS